MADANSRNGKTYAVSEKFGYNTVAYDKTKVDPADMEDMSTILSGKYDGRIAIYDYYMPVLGLMQMAAGGKTAEMTVDGLASLKEPLFKLKAASKSVGDVFPRKPPLRPVRLTC